MTLRLDGKVRDFRLRTRMLHERHQHTLGGQFLAWMHPGLAAKMSKPFPRAKATKSADAVAGSHQPKNLPFSDNKTETFDNKASKSSSSVCRAVFLCA